MYQVSGVSRPMSGVSCKVSSVRCQVFGVTGNFLFIYTFLLGIIVVYWTGTFKHFEHFWALLWLQALFYFRHFSTHCIRHYASGQLGSSEMRCSTLTISSILNVQIEDGSSDDLINQQSYTKATKMSPWPPKMATAQAFWKRQWIISLVPGGGMEGFSHPHFQGWQAFSTILGHFHTLLSPSINKPWYFGSWTSGSLPDLHLLAGAHCWSSSYWSYGSWTSNLWNLCLTAAPMRAGRVRERMVKGKSHLTQQLLNLPPSVTTILKHDCYTIILNISSRIN